MEKKLLLIVIVSLITNFAHTQITTCPVTFTNVVTVNHPGCYGAPFEIDFTVTTGNTAIYGVEDMEQVGYGMDMPYYVIVYHGGGSSWTSIGALGPFKYVQNLFDAVTGVEMVGGVSGTAGCSYSASFKLKALMPLNVSNNDTYRFGISYNLYPEREITSAISGFKKSALIMLENSTGLVAETQSTGQRTLVDGWLPPYIRETGSEGGCGSGINLFHADSVYPSSAMEWFGGFDNYVGQGDARDFDISIANTKAYKVAGVYKDITQGGGCMTRLSNILTVNIVSKPSIERYKTVRNDDYSGETILSNGQALQMKLSFNNNSPWMYELNDGTTGTCYSGDTVITQIVYQQDEAPDNEFFRMIVSADGHGCEGLDGTGSVIAIVGSITPQNIAGNYCATATDSIYFIANYHLQEAVGWPGGNKFTVEMSDASGNNFTPIDCDCKLKDFEDDGDTARTKGACAFTIPTDRLPGSGYRLRVVQRDQTDIYFGDTTVLVVNVNGSPANSFTLAQCIQTPADNNCNSSTKSNIPLNTWQHFENNGSVLASVNTLNNDLGALEMQMQYYPVSSPPSAGAIIFMNRYFDFVCNGGADCTTDGIFPNGPVQVRLYFTQAELDAHTGIANSNPFSSALAVVHNINAVLPDCTPVNNGNAVVTEIIQGAGVQFVPYANGYYAEFSLNSFSEVALSKSLSVVPVTLLSFNAFCNGNATELSWLTATEINSREIVIERSSNGSSWQAIKNILAQGQSNAVVKYQYADTAYSNGSVFYRIHIIDRDGRVAYSPVAKVNCSKQGFITIAPNPFNDVLKIQYNAKSTGKVLFQLMGMDGRISLQQSKTLRQGTQSIEINTSTLAAGMYVLLLREEDGAASYRTVIKQKN